MIYYIFEFLENNYNLPGAGVFQYISFRSALAIMTSLLVSLVFGGKIIRFIKKMQIGEDVRKLGLDGEENKKGTPTMGGLIILSAILIPTILFARLDNIYILIMIFSTVWLGIIGFVDDYIKVFKKDKAGLAGKFKILGQVGIGLIVALVMVFNNQIVVKEKLVSSNGQQNYEFIEVAQKSSKTTIPFLKNNEFDYQKLTSWMGDGMSKYAWILFVLVVVLVITAVSNGANMTDGLDGLATGVSAIIGITLAVFCYVSGNIIAADYLNIMYIPYSGELVIYMSAFVGSCIGFLWYNSYPAQVFMGDTGSLALGGIIAVVAILVRKELLIPILCGVFLIENLSVILQVGYFKYTKKKFGIGKRVFKMAPLHHHYELKGWPEPRVIVRFWIITFMLVLLGLAMLRLR